MNDAERRHMEVAADAADDAMRDRVKAENAALDAKRWAQWAGMWCTLAWVAAVLSIIFMALS